MSERERERRRRGIRGKVIGSVSCLLVHGTNYKTSARMEWSHNYIGTYSRMVPNTYLYLPTNRSSSDRCHLGIPKLVKIGQT